MTLTPYGQGLALGRTTHTITIRSCTNGWIIVEGQSTMPYESEYAATSWEGVLVILKCLGEAQEERRRRNG